MALQLLLQISRIDFAVEAHILHLTRRDKNDGKLTISAGPYSSPDPLIHTDSPENQVGICKRNIKKYLTSSSADPFWPEHPFIYLNSR